MTSNSDESIECQSLPSSLHAMLLGFFSAWQCHLDLHPELLQCGLLLALEFPQLLPPEGLLHGFIIFQHLVEGLLPQQRLHTTKV